VPRLPDASSLLALEAQALEFLAAVAGCGDRDRDALGRCGWVATVRDRIHAQRRLRIEWAAHALLREDAPVADVALRAGFADQSHFTRFFRRLMGVTPHAYRQERRTPRVRA